MGVMRVLFGAFAAIAAAFGVVEAAPTSGRLAPELRLDGSLAGGACAFSATGVAGTFESAAGTPIEVPFGRYLLRVECQAGDSRVVLPESPTVEIAAGAEAAPKVEVASVPVRFESRRNGIMLPATVRVFRAGESEGPPLTTVPTNVTVRVAAGHYDVVVALEDASSPRAEARLGDVRLKGTRTVVLPVDLSDGGLVVQATANGKRAQGAVRAFVPGKPRDVGLVDAGLELRLPAGRYRIQTELREVADFATKHREVWVEAGKVLQLTEAFETGKIAATVVRDGKPVAANVRMSLQGAGDFFNYFAAPGEASVTPGRYKLTIVSEASGPLGPIEVPDVEVKRGATTSRKVDLSQATLVVRVTKNGRPTTEEVVVQAAGGGAAVEPTPSGEHRLWPGRYEVLVRFEDGTEQIEGPFQIALGERVTKTVSVDRALITVTALRGRMTVTDAEVSLFRPGAAKPTARGRVGARIEVPPGKYDVKIVAGPDTVWRQGVRVEKTVALSVDLPPAGSEEALPDGELPQGDDLPDGDPEEPTGARAGG